MDRSVVLHSCDISEYKTVCMRLWNAYEKPPMPENKSRAYNMTICVCMSYAYKFHVEPQRPVLLFPDWNPTLKSSRKFNVFAKLLDLRVDPQEMFFAELHGEVWKCVDLNQDTIVDLSNKVFVNVEIF